MNLSTRIKVQQVINATTGAAGTTDIEGAPVDTANWDGVMFLCVMGAIVTNAVTSIKAQQGEAVDSVSAPTDITDAADLAGTAQTIADDDDNQVFIIDLYRPQERWVRPVVDRGTQNATVQSCLAILYHGRKAPTALAVANLVNYERHVSPAEGTA